MKKIITSSIIIALAITKASFSQETMKIDSFSHNKIYKNEIGINTVPALVLLMRSSPNPARLCITYKRINKKNGAARIGISYFIKKRENSNPYRSTMVNDSIQKDYYTEIYMQNNWQMNVGYEFIRKNKKLMRFYGADIFAGTGREYNHNFTILKEVDTSGITQNPMLEIQSSPLVKYNYSYVGLSPFYGLKYPILKRLDISAQFGLNISYLNGHINNTAIPKKYQNITVIDLDFTMINDVSLVYRF